MAASKDNIVKGKTASGFEYKIDPEALDDMEMLENFTAISKGDMSSLAETLTMLLGLDQKKRLYEFCRGKNGRVSMARVVEETSGIFESIKEGNSPVKN